MSRIHIPKPWQLPERLATPESVFIHRRAALQRLGWGGLGLGSLSLGIRPANAESPTDDLAVRTRPAIGDRFKDKLSPKRNPKYVLPTGVGVTSEAVSSSHNNFYEFTTAKDRVWELAKDYSVDASWKIEVDGLVEKPTTLGLDDLFTRFPLEERLYRFRCVERWAMQVPWVGFPLKALIDSLKPLSSAKFVKFVSFLDPKGLPGQRKNKWYPWPYYEALRMDEARHELAFVALGSYGHGLPMQHGAPWRVVTPWKYGYKSPKSIVRIEFVDQEPSTFWNETQPDEYGFYSNVEPHKPHPRWSQRWEQDIGTEETRETLLYNGYGDLVADLYTGDEI